MRIRPLLVVLLVLLLLLLSVGGAGFLWLRSKGRPLREGEARLAGLAAPVEVRWDRWAVPHVTAEGSRDLAAAVGYLHANDRFTQMELGRRAAAGRLSELFDERTLEVDRGFRILRLRKTAERMWDSLGEESREWLRAYAEGVNAWLGERDGDLPPLLKLFRVRPEPWHPVDSLSFVLLMANDLSFWQGRPEEARFTWLRQLGPETTRVLVGPDPKAAPDDPEAGVHVPLALMDRLQEAAEQTRRETQDPPSADEEAGSPGSNNWALGPGRTTGGAPLVANDPHLPLQLPGTFYQVLLRAPDYEAAGMTLPGVPAVVIGQSQHLAWALTTTMLDDHDLFFEDLDEDGKSVLRGEEWVPITSGLETISLRNGESVPLLIRSTDRGPLLQADLARRLPARSLAWTAYTPSDPLAAFVGLARATSLEEVLKAIGSYICPAQNLVVAHRDGGLLYTVLGRVPNRRTGDGRLPSPGWDLSYGWEGLRPHRENPTLLLSADDFLVTANEDVRLEDYPLPFPADFDTPHRAERIRQLLAERSAWSAADLAEIQNDIVSLYAKEVVELIEEDYDGPVADAYGVLAEWNGAMEVRGPSALFALLERSLMVAIFDDEARHYGLAPFSSRDRLLRLLRGEMDPRWFDNIATPHKEVRRDILSRALAQAWGEGVSRWGEEMERWDYGELHPWRLDHPGGTLPYLGRWFNRGPFGLAGSATTIAAFGGVWLGDRKPVRYGPAMRWIADLEDPDRSLAVLPAGQSGHPSDAHYDDQLELYLAGEMRPVHWSEEAIEANTVSALTLNP